MKQAINRDIVDPDMCYYVTSLSHNGLNIIYPPPPPST